MAKTEKETTTKKAPKAKAAAPAKAKKAAKAPGVETNLVRRVSVRPKSKQIETFNTGDTVNVFVKVREGEKERIQLFKGIVTKIQGSGSVRSFTVRKVSAGVGVERTFPFISPALDKVELVNTGKVRRSRLFYLRGLKGKAAKIESELVSTRSAAETTEA